MASTSQDSEALRQFARIVEQFNNNPTMHEISNAFAERKTTANVDDPDVRSSLVNPHVLAQHVNNQKEYFSKYKFKYKEQTAKKAFLQLLLSEPQHIDHDTNEKLRQTNLNAKQALKESKTELSDTYTRITNLANEIEPRYELAKTQIDEGARLAADIKEMRIELARLRAARPPEKRMTIAQLTDRLEAQDEQLVELAEEENTLKGKEVDARAKFAKLVAQLEALGPERVKAEAEARHAMSIGQKGREVAIRVCAWQRAVISLYSSMLDLDPIVAESENELHIRYGGERPYTLCLIFNPATQKLASAQLKGSDVDIKEFTDLALISDDVPTLVRNVRLRVMQDD